MVWFSDEYRVKCIDFLHDTSAGYDLPIQVTFHAIEIFDNFISKSEEPADRQEFLTYSCLTCVLLAAKMHGKYPPHSVLTLDYVVTREKLQTFEIYVLEKLDWNIHSCYEFMAMNVYIPKHMQPLYEKLTMNSYKLLQVNKYSKDIIQKAILSTLHDKDVWRILQRHEVEYGTTHHSIKCDSVKKI